MMGNPRDLRARALALALVVVIVAGCGGGRSEQHRGQADIYLRQGETQKAEELYRQAIGEDPANALAHLGLARALRDQDDDAGALASFQEAIAQDPELTEAYLQASEVMLANGDDEGAQALADSLTAFDAERGAILGSLIDRRLGDTEGALARLRAAIESEGDTAGLCLNLGVTLLGAGQAQAAEVELAKVVNDLEPSSELARMMLVEAHRQQGELGEMVTELEQIVEGDPENTPARTSLALALVDAGRLEDAEAMARTLVEEDPESGWANYALGAALLESGSRDEGLDALRKAEATLPDQPFVKSRLAALRTRAGGTAPATTPAPATGAETEAFTLEGLWNQGRLGQLVLSRAEFLNGGAPGARETVAIAAVCVGNIPVALEQAAAMPDDNPVRRFIEAYAAVLSPPASEEKLRALKEAMDAWTENEDGLLKLVELNGKAFALARMGVRGQALSIYAQCVQRAPESGATLRNIAALYQSADMPRFAVSVLQRLVSNYNNNPEARQMLFSALKSADMDKEARTFVESSFNLYPNDPTVVAGLAQSYVADGNVNVAIQVLEQAVNDIPGEQPLKLLLADALMRTGEYDKALSQLDAITDPTGMEASIDQVRATIYAEQGEWQQVLNTLGATSGGDANPAVGLVRAAALRALDRADEAAAAVPDADQLRFAAPVSISVARYALGGDAPLDSNAPRAVADAVRANAEHAAHFALALGEAGMQLFQNAQHHFEMLHEAYPDASIFAVLLLNVMARTGAEVADAEAIAAGFQSDADVLLALANVYHEKEMDSDELETLQLATGMSDRPDVWRALAGFAESRDDYATALGAYDRLLEILPNNPAVLNNAAYLILETDGDPATAKRYAENALEQVPNNANILHTLGLAELQLNELEQSQVHLQRAFELRPGDPNVSLDFGRLQLRKGETEAGIRNIQLAVLYADGFGLDFPRRDEAIRILQEQESN